MDDAGLTHRRAGLVCLVVGVLVYTNTLGCGFCFDDKAAVLENKDILPTTPWASVWMNDFWGTPIHMSHSHKSYRPLCVATFRLNYLLHELQPMGYHLVNILLHGAVCYLYVQLCGLVFSQVWPSLIAGLLFAVHPIHTEAVAGIVGRADLMAALFFVLSLLAYHKAVSCTHHTGYAHYGYLATSLVLSLCSVLSKEIGLTVTGVCLLYDYFLLQGNTVQSTFNILARLTRNHTHKPPSYPSWMRPFLWRLLIMILFTVTVLFIRLWMMVSPPTFTQIDNEALSLDFPYRQLHWVHMTFVNSHLLLNPSRLLHDYRMNAIPLITSLSDVRNILTLTTITVYVLLCLYSLVTFDLPRRPNTNGHVLSNGHSMKIKSSETNGHSTILNKPLSNGSANYYLNGSPLQSVSNYYTGKKYSSRRIVLFGLILIVLPFLPASNLLFPVGFVIAERVLYLPSMGFCLLVGYGVYRISKLINSQLISGLFWTLFVALLLTDAAKTIARNKDWHSKVTLYGSLLRQYPSNGHILANVAREYRNIDEYGKAESAYRMGMKVAPNISINFINLGSMLKKLQKYHESEEVLFETIEMLRRTIDSNPENVDKLAMVYVSASGLVSRDPARLDHALELVEEALKLNSSASNTHNSRGSLLLRKGRLDESLNEFHQAIQLQPTNTNANYNMALAYKQKGDIQSAVSALERLLSVDPSHTLARNALAELRH